MDETENVGSWGIFMKGVCYLVVRVEVDVGVGGIEVVGSGVEDVDEDADVAEDLGPLGGEVAICEDVLAGSAA